MDTRTLEELTMRSGDTRPADATLVIGGTGRTGRRVVERLVRRERPVRVGSRRGSPAFAWERPGEWPAVLRGVRAAYVAYHPDLALPGAAESVRSFADVGVAQGVRRLVLLSGRGEEEAMHAEELLQRSGAEWTIVRASWFAQNFSESFLLDAVLSGDVALPAGDVREPFVDADDIADVAVAALAEDGHAGRLYEVTGPRLLGFADAVGEIARATGRDVRYTPVPVARFSAMLVAQGVPAETVGLLEYLFTTVLDGRNASCARGVREALGREARDFADYATRTAASGAWELPVAAGGVGDGVARHA